MAVHSSEGLGVGADLWLALGLLFLHRGWITLTQFDNVSLYEKLTGRALEREEVVVEAEAEGE